MEAPDSWEEQAVEGMAQQLSETTFKPEEPESVEPGKNVFAKEFVPSFSFSVPTNTTTNPSQTSPAQSNEVFLFFKIFLTKF